MAARGGVDGELPLESWCQGGPGPGPRRALSGAGSQPVSWPSGLSLRLSRVITCCEEPGLEQNFSGFALDIAFLGSPSDCC